MSVQSSNILFGPTATTRFQEQYGSPNVVVTGAAGFIGSHLVERLLLLGCRVVGVDDFDPWYDSTQKRDNLAWASAQDDFDLIEEPLAIDGLRGMLGEPSVVFHLAGRPGVQDSWGEGFVESSHRNIDLTQRVYEMCLTNGFPRVVYASSSSVYGANANRHDLTPELSPISPYGVSKLVGEQLGQVYRLRGLNVACLRYFTVFGPRQRPDMAMHRMFEATRPDGPVFMRRGDGSQSREFTYVEDVVEATIAAGFIDEAQNCTFDIGGGSVTSLNEVIQIVEQLSDRPIRMETVDLPAGDPPVTVARTQLAQEVLGWEPCVELVDGLAEQARWHQHRWTYADSLLIAD